MGASATTHCAPTCAASSRELLAGVDLGQYNSVSSARDIPMLAEALGYTEGYDLYGTSYGTRLAQFAMRETPDDVRSVVLDGVSGVSVPNVMWSFAKRFESYVALFQQCAADAACNAAYPDLATRFGALLDKLEKAPLVFDPPLVVNPQLTFAFPPVLKQIDPDFFVQLAGLNNLVLNGGFAGAIPRLILAAEQGDVDFFRTSSLAASDPATEDVQTVVPTTGDCDAALRGRPAAVPGALPDAARAGAGGGRAGRRPASTASGSRSPWATSRRGSQAGENEADLMEALLRLSVVPNTGTTAQHLTDYATTYLSPSAAEAANAVVGQMTRNDVRATMWGIQDIAMMLGTQPDSRGVLERDGTCGQLLRRGGVHLARRGGGYVEDSPYPQLTRLAR